MTRTTGEHLIHLLEAYGVEIVFGIPGVHTIELYRGLEASPIRHITPRHEQGAGFMADGYARVTGKPGVAFVISGPGVTNIVTAMGQAWGDSVPMLVISAVNAHGRMGSGEGWLHELQDQSALVAGVSAFSRTIHHPDELAPALAQAFALFDAARPRPVHIEIPINVLAMPAPAGDAARPLPLGRPVPPHAAIAQAVALLQGAKAPLILAGGGAVGGPVAALAARLDAPVVMTTNGRGLLPAGHPLAVPLNPSLPEVRRLMAGADVVLALGTEFGSTDYDWNEDGGFVLPGTVIRCDIDPLSIRRGPAAGLGLVGDAAAAAAAILDVLGADTTSGDRTGAQRAAEARTARDHMSAAMQGDLALLELARDTLPGCVMVGDSTQLTYAGNSAYAPDAPHGYWSSASGFGTLGYGLPGAIGAAIGAPDRPVLGLSGDGGLMFTLGELATAVEAEAPVILLLHDNGGYGEIETHMNAADVTPVGVRLYVPDLRQVAAASGWAVDAPETPDAFAAALTDAAARPGPTMIYVTDDLRTKFADAQVHNKAGA